MGELLIVLGLKFFKLLIKRIIESRSNQALLNTQSVITTGSKILSEQFQSLLPSHIIKPADLVLEM
jgi:hypothetical protein